MISRVRGSPVLAKEIDLFITPDNTSFLLGPSVDYQVMTWENTGLPPIDFVTQRGPYQHGVSLRDQFLLPRVVQYRIRRQYCGRDDYWSGRNNLLDMFRPNRVVGTADPRGTLRKVRSDGTKRDLKVMVQEGPRFEAPSLDRWQQWTIDEIIRFIAHDPVFYDPTQLSVVFGTGGALTFPITFPIVFAGFGFTTTLSYIGTWLEYPSFVITGPLSAFTVTNTTTGEDITVTYVLAVGESISIDLTYGNKRITKNDGTNLIGYVSAGSDIATFHLQPGSNTIEVTATGSGAATAVSMTYYNRYIGY